MENEKLKEQIKSLSDSSKLNQTITSLNEQLRKQNALNRLQASQLLDFEQALW
jgi:hypothetical protein